MAAIRNRFALFLVLFALGCGEAEYTAGLARTSAYFSHLKKLNDNLATNALAFCEGKVQVRAPKQFTIIPAPVPVLDENGFEVDTGEPDPRQPSHYLGVDLPGLEGAWQAELQVDVNGVEEPRPAFIYLMSNDSLLAAREKGADVDPTTYLADLEYDLASTFQVSIPEGESGSSADGNTRFVEVHPPVARYHLAKRYLGINFRPQVSFERLDLPHQFILYELEAAANLQLAFLVVAPEGVATSEELDRRVTLMLDALNIVTPRRRGGLR